MSTRWLDDAETVAWVRLAAVLQLLPAALDSQLRRDAHLTHFEYFVLAMLSEAPERTLRMTALAARTSATLPRLSHVARRLEDRGLVERFSCPEDARATNARLTDQGWATVVTTTPAHVEHLRATVFDALAPEQVTQLSTITEALLRRLDPATTPASPYCPVTTGPWHRC